MRTKPGIIVLSKDDAQDFQWMSDGWNENRISNSPRAKLLMKKARACVAAGENVPDVIRRLEEAGFKVTRDSRFEGLV